MQQEQSADDLLRFECQRYNGLALVNSVKNKERLFVRLPHGLACIIGRDSRVVQNSCSTEVNMTRVLNPTHLPLNGAPHFPF
jgi:hypothetical protein